MVSTYQYNKESKELNMLFSLIVPVYNVELHIAKCLFSCLEQKEISVSEYELIIVDDGSPDNSITIAKQIIQNYPLHKVQFVTRENGGLSAARNTGLNYATGKYVWFIDSDDWVKENALFQLKDKLEKLKKNIEILVFTHQTIYDNGELSIAQSKAEFHGNGFEYLKTTGFLSACTNIYLLDFLRKNFFQFKEGILWEDSEFNIRVYALAQHVHYFSRSLYYYVRRKNSITTNPMSFKMMNSWFVEIDSIIIFFSNKNLARWQRQIINYRLAHILFGAVAGFRELSKNEYKFFKDKLLTHKKCYINICFQARRFDTVLTGLLIFFALPIAEKLLSYKVAMSIKKGEGKSSMFSY